MLYAFILTPIGQPLPQDLQDRGYHILETIEATPPTSSHFPGTAVAIVNENSPGVRLHAGSPILNGVRPRRFSSWSAVTEHTTVRTSPGVECRLR